MIYDDDDDDDDDDDAVDDDVVDTRKFYENVVELDADVDHGYDDSDE